jgi:hypothetical protein
MFLVSAVKYGVRVKVQAPVVNAMFLLPSLLLGLLALTTPGHRGRQARVVAQVTHVVGGDQVPDELLDALVSLVELERVGKLKKQSKHSSF